MSWKIAKQVSDRIAEIQVEYLEGTGKMPVVEWDLVEREPSEQQVFLGVKEG